jgi:hypothetical protein
MILVGNMEGKRFLGDGNVDREIMSEGIQENVV